MKLITVRSDSRVTAQSTSYSGQLFSCQHINLVSTIEMIRKKLYVDKPTDKAAHDGVALFQGFTSLRRIKHQPLNGFYLLAILLEKKIFLPSRETPSPTVLLVANNQLCNDCLIWYHSALTIHRVLLGNMMPGSLSFSSLVIECRGGLFPFLKRSLPFLTVNATTGNQAFSHYRCNIFPGVSYNKTNKTFLNSVRKNDVEAQVEFSLKVRERARVTCY